MMIEAFSTGGVDHIDNLATARKSVTDARALQSLDQWGDCPMDRLMFKGQYYERTSELGWAIDQIFVMLAQHNLAHALNCRRKGLASSIDAIVLGYVTMDSQI